MYIIVQFVTAKSGNKCPSRRDQLNYGTFIQYKHNFNAKKNELELYTDTKQL